MKKSKVLYLANNKIISINKLVYNRNLEELNVIKNLIEIIPNMNDFSNVEKNKYRKKFNKKLD